MGSLLDTFVQSLIPNFLSQIDKLLDFRNLKDPKLEFFEDEEQKEIPDLVWSPSITIKEEIIEDDEEMFSDFQISPDFQG